MIVSDFIPTTYSKILNPVNFFIILYNAIIYSLFISHILIIICDFYSSKDFKNVETIIAIICLVVRDFLLAIIFCIFIFMIQKIFGQSNYQDITHEENQLRCLTFALSILLLFRGLISTLQLTAFKPGKEKNGECGIIFFTIVICFEVFIDSFPLVYIVHINSKYISGSLLLSSTVLDTMNHRSYN